MRLSEILREGWRNISTNTSRLLLLSVSLSLILGLLIAADLLASKRVIGEASEFRSIKANVLVLNAPSLIDGDRCDNLTQLPAVQASGAIRSATSNLRPAALPNSPFATFEISPGFLEVLDVPATTETGILLSEDAAESIGAKPGKELVLSSGSENVAAIFEWASDGRQGNLGYAALSVSPPISTYDECWVDIWPQASELRELILATLIYSPSSEDLSPQISQLNSKMGTEIDWQARYASRLPFMVPLVTGILGTVVGAVSVRLRRLELASALHAGVRKSDLAGVLAVELSALLVTYWSVAAAVTSVLVSSIAPEDKPTLLIQAFSAASTATVGLAIGVYVALAVTRERHLFRFFKNR